MTLTAATARDLEAALADCGHGKSPNSAFAAGEGGRDKSGSDLVARRVVLRRDRWDALLRLTKALEEERGVVATPAEVAAIVLDAGLNVITEEAKEAPNRPRVLRGGERPKAQAGKKKELSPRKRTGPTARRTRARRRARNAGEAVAVLAGVDRSPLLAFVKGLRSRRSVQRACGLWLGAQHPGKNGKAQITVSGLRALCQELGAYCTDNFAQNMKKDSAYFTEVRDPESGERLGYDLTPAGILASAEVCGAK